MDFTTKYKPKDIKEAKTINALIEKGGFIESCEGLYEQRVDEAARTAVLCGCSIIMVTGPSASGKTTSSNKIAKSLGGFGKHAKVVSLDNFFKNIKEYPLDSEGNPDMENIEALDIDCINRCMKVLNETGSCELPMFDFVKQRRTKETMHIVLGKDDVLIIEGIHALNPMLHEEIPDDRLFKVYAALRTEYALDGDKAVVTKDLRITRRLVRDYLFRGYSVRNTLDNWESIQRGEVRWIKPFKSTANVTLDTSFDYEPGVFAPILDKICKDPKQGGEHRDTLMRLNEEFSHFSLVPEADVPKTSMLREFIGGLEL